MGPVLPIYAPGKVWTSLVFLRFMGFLLSQLDIPVLNLTTEVKCGPVTTSLQADGSKVQSTLVQPSNAQYTFVLWNYVK
jgi:hypothetical protein